LLPNYILKGYSMNGKLNTQNRNKIHCKHLPFIVRRCAPIALFLSGGAAIYIGFFLPESWRPDEGNPLIVGMLGILLILGAAFCWWRCDPEKRK